MRLKIQNPLGKESTDFTSQQNKEIMGEVFRERGFHRKWVWGLRVWVWGHEWAENATYISEKEARCWSTLDLLHNFVQRRLPLLTNKLSHLSSWKTNTPNSLDCSLPVFRREALKQLPPHQSFCKQLLTYSPGAPERRRVWLRDASEAWGLARRTDVNTRKRGRWDVSPTPSPHPSRVGLPLPAQLLRLNHSQHNPFLISCDSLQSHYCQFETHRKQGWGNLSFFCN